MKKISLDLDTLNVESFSTAPGAESRKGTVRAYETAGGDGCATDNVGSWCCWNTDTTCPGGGGDSYWCGDDISGPSHLPSCGEFCDITGIPYKCYDG